MIDGLKLENEILKEVRSNESDVLLAYLPSHSLGYLYDLESNRELFLYKLKDHDIFLKVSESVDSLMASAVKIDESSGMSCILLWLSDITAQPTFEPSFDPSV